MRRTFLIFAFLIMAWLGIQSGKPEIVLAEGYCNPRVGVQYILGCSPLGQKMISLITWGAAGTIFAAVAGLVLSFLMSLVGLALAVLIGPTGFFLLDNTSRALLSVPSIFLAVTLGVALGSGITALIIAIGVSEWAYIQQWLMGRYTDMNNSQFATAARIMGASEFYIFRKHLLLQFIDSLKSIFVINLPLAVLAVASLEFLGVSAGSDYPSLGYQISAWKDYLFLFPHIALSPIAMLLVILLIFARIRSGLTTDKAIP